MLEGIYLDQKCTERGTCYFSLRYNVLIRLSDPQAQDIYRENFDRNSYTIIEIYQIHLPVN